VPVSGIGLITTVNGNTAKQPDGSVYEIIVVPPELAVTIPEDDTDATTGVPVLHMPPVVVSIKVVDWPLHREDAPVIGEGSGVTITEAVVRPHAPEL
jgi:hypothetical protein